MKLATYKNNTRDGQLLVVSRDLKRASVAEKIAPTLQYALDNWKACEGKLRELSEKLNAGKIFDCIAFEEAQCESPLPRAYQWADASSYVTHIELVRKSRGVEMPKELWTDPLMYQGGSDTFFGPHDSIPLASNEDWGLDYEAEVAIVTDDVPMGIQADKAKAHTKLLMLVNDVSLRNLVPGELAKGFGFFQSKPSSAFSPVAITPDELGDAWDGKVHVPIFSHINNKKIGSPNAGIDMIFDFPRLIQHAARTRSLGAGTIIGSGTVSNADRSLGSSCLVEVRMLEKLNTGEIKTPFLKAGDIIRIEMFDKNGCSIFGKIEQKVTEYERK